MKSLNIFLTLLCFFIVVCSQSSIIAQDDDSDDDEVYSKIIPKHSLTVELGMPVSISSKGYKGLMQGIVNVSPYYHYNFKNNLSLGIGGNYSFFWINHVLAPDTKNIGGIHAVGGFVKVGHEKFHTERLGTDIGIKVGVSQLNFSSVNNRALGNGVVNQNVFYIEPTLGIVLSADEFTSYRWIVGYTIQNYTFNPTQLGFKAASFSSSDYNKLTQFLTVGFGFTYYFKQH